MLREHFRARRIILKDCRRFEIHRKNVSFFSRFFEIFGVFSIMFGMKRSLKTDGQRESERYFGRRKHAILEERLYESSLAVNNG